MLDLAESRGGAAGRGVRRGRADGEEGDAGEEGEYDEDEVEDDRELVRVHHLSPDEDEEVEGRREGKHVVQLVSRGIGGWNDAADDGGEEEDGEEEEEEVELSLERNLGERVEKD